MELDEAAMVWAEWLIMASRTLPFLIDADPYGIGMQMSFCQTYWRGGAVALNGQALIVLHRHLPVVIK